MARQRTMRGAIGMREAGAIVGALVLVAALLPGCVTVDYVGKSYVPTANVDVFMAAADVKRPYETMGEIRAQVEAMPFTSPAQQLQDKLVAEARARGANGIILGSLDQRQVGSVQQTTGQATTKKKSSSKKKTNYTETTTTSTEEVVGLRGTLIRYTAE
jgi:hypothetical protein